jgi:hypothetical protein
MPVGFIEREPGRPRTSGVRLFAAIALTLRIDRPMTLKNTRLWGFLCVTCFKILRKSRQF